MQIFITLLIAAAVGVATFIYNLPRMIDWLMDTIDQWYKTH